MKSSRVAALLPAALSFVMVAAAHAHAPLARDLALAPGESGALSVRMPGFGFLVRESAEQPFAYACDALLGVSPLEEHVPIAYRADGALLVGTAQGLRVVDASGCPRDEVLIAQPVVALAVHPVEPERAYAVTAEPGGAARVHRSDDGGETFVPAALLAAHPVTGLALDASDPDSVVVSQRVEPKRASILRSRDGAGSFEGFERVTDFAVLYVHPSTQAVSGRESRDPQGVSFLRIPDLAVNGAEELLALNFFGGFAADPADPDTLFVGDEARGIYRSGTAGDRFRETLPDVASASLAFGASGLWSTTAGLPHQPALVRSSDGIAPAETILALGDVTSLVECPAIEVEEICAAAWIEWERDVLGALPVQDAAVEDSGAPAADAGEPDASASDASPGTGGGCSCSTAGARRGSGSLGWLALLLALSVSAYRCGGPSSRG